MAIRKDPYRLTAIINSEQFAKGSHPLTTDESISSSNVKIMTAAYGTMTMTMLSSKLHGGADLAKTLRDIQALFETKLAKWGPYAALGTLRLLRYLEYLHFCPSRLKAA